MVVWEKEKVILRMDCLVFKGLSDWWSMSLVEFYMKLLFINWVIYIEGILLLFLK